MQAQARRCVQQLPLLILAMAIGGYVRTALNPLQESVRVALSLSDNQIGLLQGPAVGIPVVLSAIPLGMLIDRYSRTHLLFLLVALSVVANVGTAFAVGFGSLVCARVVAGLTSVAIQPVVFSLVSDLYDTDRRGRATTAVIIGQVAGIAAAFALGGVAVTRVSTVANDWTHAVLTLGVPLLPIPLILLLLREPRQADTARPHLSLSQVWRDLRPYRARITLLALGIMLMETAVSAILIWGAPMLSRRFGLLPDRAGATMATAMLVSGILGPVVGGALADLSQRSGGPPKAVLAISLVSLASLPCGLFAFVSHAAFAGAVLIVDMTVMLAVAVMGIAVFTIVIPEEIRGVCLSALVAANLLVSFAVAPVLVSLVSGALGGLEMIGVALSICCTLAGALAALSFAAARQATLTSVNAT